MPYLNIINSILQMWNSQLLDFESEYNIQMLQMREPLSPPQFDSDTLLVEDKTQNPLLEFPEEQKDYSDSSSSSEHRGKEYSTRLEANVRTRAEWTEEQEIHFFNFLGKYMIKFPRQFLSWKTGNKRGIFKEMVLVFKNGDRNRCRLKFRTYKRKHSNKKDKANYETCMRSVIIKKLRQYAKTDKQSRQILKILGTQEIDLEEKEKFINVQIQELKKQDKTVKSIFSQLVLLTQQGSEVKKQEIQKNNNKKDKSIYKFEDGIITFFQPLEGQNSILKQEQCELEVEKNVFFKKLF